MSKLSKVSSQRALRIGEEIRHVLAYLIERNSFHNSDLTEKRLTITEVRVSVDLRKAIVFVVPLGGGDPTQVLSSLEHSRSFLRYMLGKIAKLPFTPELSFKADICFDTASKIERILRRPDVQRDLLRKK